MTMPIKLQTPVGLRPSPGLLSQSDRILAVGSCFADETGRRLADDGFRVCINPFGTLYNPVSVCNALSRLASAAPFTAEDCVEMGAGAGLVCSFSHHTSFARETPEAFLEHANARLAEAAACWKACNKVLVTLGSAWCFRSVATGETVANCLKRPAGEFERYPLSVEQTAAMLERLIKRFSDKQFIFTVSPIRHLADGAHGNQLSKATLLLATDRLDAPYFPAYELLLDELRDYRFYAEDMVHPSAQATDYIYERFLEWSLTPDDRLTLDARRKLLRFERHRPLH